MQINNKILSNKPTLNSQYNSTYRFKADTNEDAFLYS